MKIKLLHKDAQMPKRATSGSAGFDLSACLEDAVFINPGETKMLPTGISIELKNELYVGLIFARSSIAVNHGINLANAVGVIDSDYRGEIMIALKNTSSEPFQVNYGDRIAQLVILPIVLPKLEISDELEPSERGNGGFGSTGV